ncbi:hypothetical protein [Synechococcus sp. HK01-R]|uniref:hypothetical protein n=1 Tax=Synechococcus sp. HK01-R TaxID=2751171 RepID=UPI00162A6442|nr:hypothetical protein [Synechococcus sp. HK01-R]QNG27844.1 hypothetical protein H0O21_04490 [Synechococcus sp. HK01-R]
MTHKPPEQAQLDALWREVNKAITDRAWPEAEGLLLRYLQLVPQAALELWDVLAYVDLMQGDYRRCLQVLQPWADHPSRNFWLQHKLGDAHRGLNQLPQAEACYRQSLVDGSDSPLTIRNLLQVLDGLDPGRAVREVQQWLVDAAAFPSAAAWEGARQAAVLVPGLALAEQLRRCGQADAACRRRLLDAAAYRLDLSRLAALLQEASASAAGLSAWEGALQQRLRRLQLWPVTLPTPAGRATSAPGADAQFRSAAPG